MNMNKMNYRARKGLELRHNWKTNLQFLVKKD